MNFDFIKNLRGFNGLYEDCSNAEKLAVSMPVQSLFTSRRSAELLAKFIYMTAHNERMEDMTFVDILKDEEVKKYVSNRHVMDAFHYIRKNGNRAVHGEFEETSENAIGVLQDLHYVVGETACKMGLISEYPDFEADIDRYDDVHVSEEDINNKATQMFLEFVEQFNSERERENYYNPTDEEFLEYVIEGNVDLHEYLEFHRKPKHVAIIEFLQEYLLHLCTLAVQRPPELAEELTLNDPVLLNIRMQIDGEKVYSTDANNIMDFTNAVRIKLPEADSFIIDCRCKGNLREICYGDENEEWGKFGMLQISKIWDGSGMQNKLESFKHRELFSYRKVQYFPDSGNITAAAIIKGKTKDITDLFSDEILSYPNLELQCDGYRIYVDGVLEEYPELFEEIKRIVRDNVFESEISYCEETWDPSDDNYEEGCIMPFVQIRDFTIGGVELFLNKLNQCLKPWKDELEFWIGEPNFDDPLFGTNFNILYNLEDLSLATVVLKDGELHLAGSVIEYNKLGYDTVNSNPGSLYPDDDLNMTDEEVMEIEAFIDKLVSEYDSGN